MNLFIFYKTVIDIIRNRYDINIYEKLVENNIRYIKSKFINLINSNLERGLYNN